MEPTSRPSTTLCFCGGEASAPQTVLGDVGKSRRGEGKKSGCTTSSASHLMLLSWVSLTLVALPSSRVQAGPTLAGGAAALGVWRVLLIDGVEQQARGWPRQVGMPRLSSMLLRGLAEPFLLVARRPHMAAVTEV